MRQKKAQALSPDGKLPAKWHTSVKRALVGLAATCKPAVIVDLRQLTSMDEFIRHYPGKSLIAQTRQLRLDLLPALADFTNPLHEASLADDDHFSIATSSPAKSYSQAENEIWYVRHKPDNNIDRVRKAWISLEQELIAQLPRLAGVDQSNLFMLITRAKSLFKLEPITCQRSIAECAGSLAEHRALPPMLLKRLMQFCNTVVPPDQVAFLRFKSFIRTLADIPKHGNNHRLRGPTLDHLEATCPDTVQALPGYQPARPRGNGFIVSYDGNPHATHGADIHKLLDKTVFEKFNFIRLS